MIPHHPNLDSVRRILVIKLRHLGDVLLTSPVFTQLKKRFPQAEIDAYIWEESFPMLEGHPGINGFILYDRKWKKLSFLRRVWKEALLLHKIKKNHYDLVIHLTEGDRGAVAAWVSGATIKVGVDPGKKRKRKQFTHLVKSCPNPRHAVERDLDALRRIGIFPQRGERELYFHLPKEAVKTAQSWVGEDPFILIHSTSRWRFKCPPPQLIGEVINKLKGKVVLTGAPSEKEVVEEVLRYTTVEILNLAGLTTLKEMGALVALAQGVITVDTVTLHLASAFKVPVVALFGPTSEENWGPWNHPFARVITENLPCRPCRLDGCGGSKKSDCLTALSPQEIVEALSAVVSAKASSCGSSNPPLLILNSLETKKTE